MLLMLAVSSIAESCNAQTLAQDPFGPIPAWVKIDRADLALNARQANPANQVPYSVTRNLAEHPAFEASPFHLAKTSQLSYIDTHRMADRPSNQAFPKETDSPPNMYGRPALEVSDGWKMSMPSIRKNVAKLLLQHSF
jgi:hypothetical protein